MSNPELEAHDAEVADRLLRISNDLAELVSRRENAGLPTAFVYGMQVAFDLVATELGGVTDLACAEGLPAEEDSQGVLAQFEATIVEDLAWSTGYRVKKAGV